MKTNCVFSFGIFVAKYNISIFTYPFWETISKNRTAERIQIFLNSDAWVLNFTPEPTTI